MLILGGFKLSSLSHSYTLCVCFMFHNRFQHKPPSLPSLHRQTANLRLAVWPSRGGWRRHVTLFQENRNVQPGFIPRQVSKYLLCMLMLMLSFYCFLFSVFSSSSHFSSLSVSLNYPCADVLALKHQEAHAPTLWS